MRNLFGVMAVGLVISCRGDDPSPTSPSSAQGGALAGREAGGGGAVAGAGGTSSGGTSGAGAMAGMSSGGSGQAGSVPAGSGGQAGGALRLDGTGSLDALDAEWNESFSLALDVQNASAGTLTLQHSQMLVAHQGGFAFALGDAVAEKGNFHGLGPALEPMMKPAHLSLKYVWSTPLTHVVYRLEAVDEADTLQAARRAIPLSRAGFEPPPVDPFDDDVVITLQEPLQAIELATGERWLTLVGQVANLTSRTVSVSSLDLTIRHGDSTVLTADLRPKLDAVSGKAPLKTFLFTTALPADIADGDLTISGQAKLGGETRTLGRKATFTTAEAVLLRSPVQGLWRWNNGQGQDVYHTHFQYPEQRYAYDLVRVQQGSTHAGAPAKNESYFAFGQPVLAMADGVVRTVIDDVPDNLGNQPSPDSKPTRNSLIVLQHDQGYFSLYAHVRQVSAVVQVGQSVKAGDPLAQVGNAGFSTEPHLHFACFRIDASGRVQALPMRFDNLLDSSGQPTTLTPHGALDYEGK